MRGSVAGLTNGGGRMAALSYLKARRTAVTACNATEARNGNSRGNKAHRNRLCTHNGGAVKLSGKAILLRR